MHIDLLSSIEKLEKLGFEGSDVCLATSLFEYDLAWLVRDEDILFVHPINECNGKFDRTSFDKNTDVFEEFDWVEWDSFFSTVDSNKEDFSKLPLEQQIYSLYSYYGYQNIFGESYWEGFEIKE